MAIKEVKRYWESCQLDYVKEFLCHTEEDVKQLPACCVGSKAYVNETGNWYACGKDQKWKLEEEATEEGGGNTGGGGGLPSGGTPYQYLVTDGEGKTTWADRLAWSSKSYQEIMPEETFEVDPVGSSGDTAGVSENAELLAAMNATGTKLAVTWNGKVYECQSAKIMGNTPFAGNVYRYILQSGMANPEDYGYSEDTGEPFGIFVLSGKIMFVPLDGSTVFTVSVSTIAEDIKPVPSEFLPPSNKVVINATADMGTGSLTLTGEGTALMTNAAMDAINGKMLDLVLRIQVGTGSNVAFATFDCCMITKYDASFVFGSKLFGTKYELVYNGSTWEVTATELAE